jgi:hypothetical protein
MVDFFPIYSYLKDSTGLVVAALIDWQLTVIRAINTEIEIYPKGCKLQTNILT